MYWGTTICGTVALFGAYYIFAPMILYHFTGNSPSTPIPEDTFVDDLIAANRMKTYLVGSGSQISTKIIAELARLTDEYIGIAPYEGSNATVPSDKTTG